MKCNGMYLKSIFSFTIMSKLVRSNISKMSRGDQKLFKNYVSWDISFLRKGLLITINGYQTKYLQKEKACCDITLQEFWKPISTCQGSQIIEIKISVSYSCAVRHPIRFILILIVSFLSNVDIEFLKGFQDRIKDQTNYSNVITVWLNEIQYKILLIKE